MVASNGHYSNRTPNGSFINMEYNGTPTGARNPGWWEGQSQNDSIAHVNQQAQHQQPLPPLQLQLQPLPPFPSTPIVMTPAFSMHAWPSGTPPSVGDTPVSYAYHQLPPPPPPLLQGQPLPLPSQSHALAFAHSAQQHRFDQTFIRPPPPPPPPPQVPPLVPQQIRRRNPSIRRRTRKRKPGTLSNDPLSNENESSRSQNSKNMDTQLASSNVPKTGVSAVSTSAEETTASRQDINRDAASAQLELSSAFDLVTVTAHHSSDTQSNHVDDAKGIASKSSSVSNDSSISPTPSESESIEAKPAKKLKNRKQLEMARARLELLKKKRSAMQGGLKVDTASATASEAPEDVQVALKRAREKLRGALQGRERAMQRFSPVHQTPISGLSSDLTIKNISQTGPEDMVCFPSTNLGLDLGRAELEELIGDDFTTDDSGSLAARKLQLQRELLALKERLEEKQKASWRDSKGGGDKDDDNDNDTSMEVTRTQAMKQLLTKEELEKRKEEARAVVDISYWKHFVSKQEHILSEVDEQVDENRKALEKCSREVDDTAKDIQKADDDIHDLETRERAVADMASNVMKKLLSTRKELHSEKEKQSAVA
jgi:hypothetical protein